MKRLLVHSVGTCALSCVLASGGISLLNREPSQSILIIQPDWRMISVDKCVCFNEDFTKKIRVIVLDRGWTRFLARVKSRISDIQPVKIKSPNFFTFIHYTANLDMKKNRISGPSSIVLYP